MMIVGKRDNGKLKIEDGKFFGIKHNCYSYLTKVFSTMSNKGVYTYTYDMCIF